MADPAPTVDASGARETCKTAFAWAEGSSFKRTVFVTQAPESRRSGYGGFCVTPNVNSYIAFVRGGDARHPAVGRVVDVRTQPGDDAGVMHDPAALVVEAWDAAAAAFTDRVVVHATDVPYVGAAVGRPRGAPLFEEADDARVERPSCA